jgi:hypothetical protein
MFPWRNAVSDPTTNSTLEKIASNTGGSYGGKAVRKQIDILQEIATNTANGSGGGGPAYDDTAIKNRMTAVEQKNIAQDELLDDLTAEDGVLNQTLNQLSTAVQTATQKNTAQDQSISGLQGQVDFLNVYHSHMIVPWGDSRSAQNWNTNTVPPSVLARSWLWWTETLSQRVRVNVDYMQGVSGDRMVDLLNRIQQDSVPAGGFGTKKPSEVPPCIAALLCWTNSVNAGTPLVDLLAQTNAVLDYLLARGHKVILIAEWPRGAAGQTDGSLTADNQKLLLATHNALLYIVDVWPRVADPASVNAYPLPNMLNPDNLHNSPGIAMITGQEITRVLVEELKLPRLKMTTSSNTDIYDAVLQPHGNIISNPMLITPGGTVGTNATAGTAVPLGYTLSATAGLTVSGAFVTITLPDGSKRKGYQMTVSGTPTTAGFGTAGLRQTGLLSKVAANDILEANYEFYVADGHANFGSPSLRIDNAVNAGQCQGGLVITGDNITPTEAVRAFYGVARTPDKEIGPTLPASLAFEMRAYFTIPNVAVSLTMTFLSASLRKKKI